MLASGPLSAMFSSMAQTSNYATGLLTAQTFQKTISLLCFFFFAVLNPYRLEICFIAFIRIVCCISIYSTNVKPCNWFFLRMFRQT